MKKEQIEQPGIRNMSDEKAKMLVRLRNYYLSDRRAGAADDIIKWIDQKVCESNFLVTREDVMGIIDIEQQRSGENGKKAKISDVVKEAIKDGLLELIDSADKSAGSFKISQVLIANAFGIRAEYMSMIKNPATISQVPEDVWFLFLKCINSGKTLIEYLNIKLPEEPEDKEAAVREETGSGSNITDIDRGKSRKGRKVSEIKEKRPKIKNKTFRAFIDLVVIQKISDSLRKAKKDEGLKNRDIARCLVIAPPYVSMLLKCDVKHCSKLAIERATNWMCSGKKLTKYRIPLSDEEKQFMYAPAGPIDQAEPVLTDTARADLLKDIYNQYLADQQDGFVSNTDQWCIEKAKEHPGIKAVDIHDYIKNANKIPTVSEHIPVDITFESPELKELINRLIRETGIYSDIENIKQSPETLIHGISKFSEKSNESLQSLIKILNESENNEGTVSPDDEKRRRFRDFYRCYYGFDAFNETRMTSKSGWEERCMNDLVPYKQFEPLFNTGQLVQMRVDVVNGGIRWKVFCEEDPEMRGIWFMFKEKHPEIPVVEVKPEEKIKVKQEEVTIIDNCGSSIPLYKEKPGFFRGFFKKLFTKKNKQ